MVGILEQRVELRSLQLGKTREARGALNAAKIKTERLIAANELIQDRAAGFADTVTTIVGIAPSAVDIKTVDDDGRVVAVEAEAGGYAILLAYIRLLEDIPPVRPRSSAQDRGSARCRAGWRARL